MARAIAKTAAGKRQRYAVKLRDCAGDGSLQAGSKAGSLAKLLAAGFPVPDGFVVTVAAFDDFIASLDRRGISQETVERSSMPPAIEGELADAIADLGNVPVAVRSSGVAEDLPDASFAGQYETVLDVHGVEAILEAIKRCWASAFNKRVTAYRETHGITDGLHMAVLVQRLIRADAAGVAFTANPVTGDRSETVVSAVRGLGERLVSGQASPDEWIVKEGKATCQRAPEHAINAAMALEVASLARRVEKHFGSPQDVEWAAADGKLCLLQARPVTTLADKGADVAAESAPPGFWEREISHYPRPLSPMFGSMWLPVQNACFRRVFDELSPLIETIELREINGWVYQRMVPFGGKDRKAPPAFVVWLMVRLIPAFRSRIKGSMDAVSNDIFGAYVDRWFKESKPQLKARIAELGRVELAKLSNDDLDRAAGEVIRFMEQSADVHFRLNAPTSLLVADLAFACRDLLDWDDKKTVELLAGLSEKSSEPSQKLARLAMMASARPNVRSLFDHIDSNSVARLAEMDREFAEAFKQYMGEFGCRALRYELTEPTLAEKPELVLGLIRDQLAQHYDATGDARALEQKRSAVVAEARKLLQSHPVKDRERFERALERAQKAYPIREDNEFYTVSCPYALVRYAFLEIGKRLVKRGQLVDAGDVFFLKTEEARAALKSGATQAAIVAKRKAERAAAVARRVPVSYGKPPGPPPSLAVLPAGARFMMEAILWATERVFALPQSTRRGGKGDLDGIAASAGLYTGTVRVVMNENEFGKVHAGDVLVCPITSPVWSVLFPSIGAVVTDTGGILSHSAIIAREYRIPAVVATASATSTLHDGEQVMVDGNQGIVTRA